jgi:hypothetical protein
MVYLSHARGRTIFGSLRQMDPSRFLRDLPSGLLDHNGGPDRPLMPRMFGDEVATVQETLEDAGIDMTEILQRVRANQAEARRRQEQTQASQPVTKPVGKKSSTKTSPHAGSAGASETAAPAKAPRTGKKAPRQPKAKASATGAATAFTTGTRIVHEDWGKGIVVSVSQDEAETILTVAFEKKGIKKLLAGHPKLKARK